MLKSSLIIVRNLNSFPGHSISLLWKNQSQISLQSDRFEAGKVFKVKGLSGNIGVTWHFLWRSVNVVPEDFGYLPINIITE
jgi:hypothetical protein